MKVVKEGAEPPLFKQMFKEWNKAVLPRMESFESMTPKSREKAVVDIEAMVKQSKSGDEQPVDDGNGELTIWRIENFQRVSWPRDQYGEFYSGDSYVILYKYKENGRRDAAIIYYWQGRDSSQDEKASAALLAKELDDSMGGYPVQVRVVQGKEPNHFFMLFKGRMVVHHGGKASGFKNKAGAGAGDDKLCAHGRRCPTPGGRGALCPAAPCRTCPPASFSLVPAFSLSTVCIPTASEAAARCLLSPAHSLHSIRHDLPPCSAARALTRRCTTSAAPLRTTRTPARRAARRHVRRPTAATRLLRSPRMPLQTALRRRLQHRLWRRLSQCDACMPASGALSCCNWPSNT